jgi:hypothetical protein
MLLMLLLLLSVLLFLWSKEEVGGGGGWEGSWEEGVGEVERAVRDIEVEDEARRKWDEGEWLRDESGEMAEGGEGAIFE